ncbi:MAG: hypothetical protein ABIJ25_07575 [Pseudomonadota bacterium]
MESGNIWQAVRIIIVADMSMGIDNMLAVGAVGTVLKGIVPE